MLRIQLLVVRACRASRSVATRLWYDSPAALMAAYLVLAVAAGALDLRVNGEVTPLDYPWLLVLAFWCWRVVRRGWISRGILLYLSVLALSRAVQPEQVWQIQSAGALLISLTGLMLLLSPAVYARTHPGSVAASPRVRLRPPRWMIWSAPLAGSVIAGVTLPVTHRWYVPGHGCMIGPVQSLPPHCVGVGRGFPVPVVWTIHGQHAVSQLAFVDDCFQWTLVIFLASYLLWLALRRRQPSATGLLADGDDLVARPSQ